MADKQSLIYSALAVDPALSQAAPYRFDPSDRQYIDNQIRGCEQHLVEGLINGTIATWVLVDPSSVALNAGDVVTPVSTTSTPAVAFASSFTSKAGAGVVLVGAAPGAKARVAFGGYVPASITGLSAVAGYVRITSGRCERVAIVSATDYIIGVCDTLGNLFIMPSPSHFAVPPSKVAIYEDSAKITGLTSTSATTVISYTLPTQSMVEIMAHVFAIRTDVTNQDNSASAIRRGTFRRIGSGSAAMVTGAVDTIGVDKADAGITLTTTMAAVANSALVQVATASGQTLDVAAHMYVRQITR